MERLGLNRSGYFGERIDIDPTLEACAAAARRNGWQVGSFPASAPGLMAQHRPAPAGRASAPRGTRSAGGLSYS